MPPIAPFAELTFSAGENGKNTGAFSYKSGILTVLYYSRELMPENDRIIVGASRENSWNVASAYTARFDLKNTFIFSGSKNGGICYLSRSVAVYQASHKFSPVVLNL